MHILVQVEGARPRYPFIRSHRSFVEINMFALGSRKGHIKDCEMSFR